MMRRSLALILLASACARPSSQPSVAAIADDGPQDPAARLEFRIEGRTVRTASLGDLARSVGLETVESYDGYYRRPKRFRALRLDRVLAEAFGAGGGAPLTTRHFILRARDGYTVPMTGERLLEGGAYLAVRDLDAPSWEPIGPQRANPGPAYLVWREPNQVDLETHPRPWQLAAIEIATVEAVFPHTVPSGEGAGSAARRGWELFTEHCIRCHAINREGGRVGPDLSVPLNVTEYRPEAQIRAYIRNPLAFRYGAMPAHPGLGEADLDALVAYLRAMATRKHDPDARTDGGAP